MQAEAEETAAAAETDNVEETTVAADEPPSAAEIVVSNAFSSAGDSIASVGCEPETRIERKQPLVPFEGDISERRRSSKWNSEPEVGNCGFYYGN